ncbi:MAG: 50S ribosomal protein L24e [Nanoarchaeota archaeon]|nr:50S ribosomal protein L24e [Nanoarchaeota archaeon]
MKCVFCKKTVEKGKGTRLVKKEGKVLDFCSSKCEKNMLKLKRNPQKKKWSRKVEE